MNYQPIIIIGAPRSGTNMLRDVLCELDGIGTWPCDEINYIWRHGNVKVENDEFSPELATENVRRYIRNEFNDLAEKQNLNVVIEKTCANSLRVPFVEKVIPEAKYIFIYRDGIDATGSALKRWKAELDIPYILQKVRYVPIIDLPYYGLRYFANRIFRLFSKESRLAFWGPEFKGFKEVVKNHTLEEVCAIQWKQCIDLSEDAFSQMSPDKVTRVSYESFVTQPKVELTRILSELNLKYDETVVEKATESVNDNSLGKGRKALDDTKLKQVDFLIKDTLKRYDYE